MRPDYGCNLDELVFEPLTTTFKTYIKDLIQTAILYHEPRIEVNKIELDDKELGGLIRHNGWIFHLPPGMRLTWPVYTYNPYKGRPELELAQAIGALSMPLKAENQEFRFTLDVD